MKLRFLLTKNLIQVGSPPWRGRGWVKFLYEKLLIACIISFCIVSDLSGQVRIRLFTGQKPRFVLLNVSGGEFELNSFSGTTRTITPADLVLIARYNNQVLVKIGNSNAIVCDSIRLKGKTPEANFILRREGNITVSQSYSGELLCKPDLGTLLLINTADTDQYIAGVVRAEGGSGKHPEYIKSQALITRTYMEKYYDRHIGDGYNLCDDTHCQVYQGISTDTVIMNAALETRGEIIVGPDSLPIIAAFHSNCGGETAPSEFVWLSPQPYLVKVTDPFCLSSRNAAWEKTIPMNGWAAYLVKEGMTDTVADNSVYAFTQRSRVPDYVAGTFRIPLTRLREQFDLRSAFFSVTVAGDSVLLKGKGYGHGVGLCQEGAMVMASKGFTYRQIISFYYTGVAIKRVEE